MLRILGRFLLWLSGWKLDTNIPKESQRCVMIASPHTSNWDFYFMRISFFLLNIPMRFTVKRFWTQFPFNLIMVPMGGLGIDRRPKKSRANAPSYVELMAAFFETRERIAMVVTPEGTRARNDRWKKGFYFTAVKANVPITFGYLDYATKTAGIGGPLYPTGDYEKDMQVINGFYRDITGKHPDRFSLDKRYDKGK